MEVSWRSLGVIRAHSGSLGVIGSQWESVELNGAQLGKEGHWSSVFNECHWKSLEIIGNQCAVYVNQFFACRQKFIQINR